MLRIIAKNNIDRPSMSMRKLNFFTVSINIYSLSPSVGWFKPCPAGGFRTLTTKYQTSRYLVKMSGAGGNECSFVVASAVFPHGKDNPDPDVRQSPQSFVVSFPRAFLSNTPLSREPI